MNDWANEWTNEWMDETPYTDTDEVLYEWKTEEMIQRENVNYIRSYSITIRT